jgi:hypothetical protein
MDSFIYLLEFRLYLGFRSLVQHGTYYKSSHMWSAEIALRIYEWPVPVDNRIRGKCDESNEA